jgi:branched-chain amino acid transport system substrate-binding protein
MWRDAYTKLLTDQIIKAYNMALEERDYQIGNATVQLVDLSDSTASRGSWDAPTEISNATNAVNDPSVLVYLGPSVSAMARAAIPVLCPAQLPIIGFDTTYPGLTKPSPYAAPGEPDIYYPDCQRNFARVVPTDELQGAAAAQFAKQLGSHNVYVVHDGTAYGRGVAGVFASTAATNGLALVGGPEGMDPAASDYRSLAQRIRQANPDLVYFGGLDGDNAPRLWKDLRAALGTKVTLMGADGISEDSFVTATGSAAEGTYATFPGIPAARLSGNGADWYVRYKQAFHEEPQPYVAYAYEAMKVALDAIARAGKMDRAAIRDAIFATRDYDGILGKWSFTETGDTTLTTMSVWQVRNGAWDPSTMQIIDARR